MKYYAGVGSRKTPDDIINAMTRVAIELRKHGYTLRSGGALGADRAFEKGSLEQSKIFIADDAKGDSRAHELMEQHHPAPRALRSQYVRNLMARNGYQVLGRDLKTPSEFVICWTPDGADGTETRTSRETGGTGQAIRIAVSHDIPVINMQQEDWEDKLFKLTKIQVHA